MVIGAGNDLRAVGQRKAISAKVDADSSGLFACSIIEPPTEGGILTCHLLGLASAWRALFPPERIRQASWTF